MLWPCPPEAAILLRRLGAAAFTIHELGWKTAHVGDEKRGKLGVFKTPPGFGPGVKGNSRAASAAP